MSLKIATLADAPKLKRLTQLFSKESPYESMKVNEEKADKIIQAILENKEQTNICILSMDGDVAVGALVATTSEILFSEATVAQELMWFVEKDYRNSRRSLELLGAFEYWAKEVKKVDLIQIASMNPENQERIDKLYKRRGFNPVERFYMKELV